MPRRRKLPVDGVGAMCDEWSTRDAAAAAPEATTPSMMGMFKAVGMFLTSQRDDAAPQGAPQAAPKLEPTLEEAKPEVQAENKKEDEAPASANVEGDGVMTAKKIKKAIKTVQGEVEQLELGKQKTIEKWDADIQSKYDEVKKLEEDYEKQNELEKAARAK